MKNHFEAEGRVDASAPAAALETDLVALYNVPVPDLRFDFDAVPASPRPFARRHWRPALALAAAAAISVLVARPAMFGGEATSVSAEELLQRTNAAVAEGNASAASAQPYHLVARTQSTGMTCSGSASSDDASGDSPAPASPMTCEPAGMITSGTEMWFVDGTHFRSSQTFTDRRDASPSTFGQAVNGDDAWLYMSDARGHRIVHGPAAALGLMTTESLALSDSASLADVLGAFQKDGCQSARLAGNATVAGRSAYVIEVRPTLDTCGPTGVQTNARNVAFESTLTVWVDSETYLPLKTESRAPDGTLVYDYTVTELQVGSDVPASAFEYAPPAGAQVTEVTNPTDAERALTGESDKGGGGGASSAVPESGTSPAEPVTPIAR